MSNRGTCIVPRAQETDTVSPELVLIVFIAECIIVIVVIEDIDTRLYSFCNQYISPIEHNVL